MRRARNLVRARRIRGLAPLLCVSVLLAIVPGALATQAAAAAGPAPVSDDFSGGLDASRWMVVDPRGDASVSTVGAGTRNAQLVIGVPAGVVHEAWGTNTAPRVMQSVTDGDFGVEAKFDSLPTSKFQDQGVLVEQDAGRWLRFSVYSDGPGKFVFAASTTKGVSTQRLKATVSMSTPPLWMRVVRTGSVWQLLWSADGVAWTSVGSFDDVLTVSKVGVYAGNSGSSPPAFQSKVDYLFDAATPIALEDGGDKTAPVISGVSVVPSSSRAVVSFMTDEPTTGRVEFGTSSTYGSQVLTSSTAASHSVVLPGLTPTTAYHYRVVVVDAVGNESVTGDGTVTTPTIASGAAPVSDDFSGGLDASRWMVVDPRGDASVSTVGAGTRDAQLVIGVPAGVVHEAWGTNTAPRVMQSVTDGDFGVEAKFDSLPTSKFQDQGVLVEQDAGRWLRFSVYSDGPGKFVFAASTTKGVSTQRLKATVSMSTPPLWLRVVRTGSVWQLLWSADGVAWTSVGSFDDVLTVSKVGVYAGNSGSSPPAFQSKVDYLFDAATPIALEDGGDKTAPVISGVSVVPSSSRAVVSFMTDEPTTGRVEFGTSSASGSVVTSSAYESQVPTSSTTTSHAVTLSGLEPTTAYHYRVVALDAAGNESVTGDGTFTTPTVASGAAPVSDDFSGGLDASRWMVVDPRGDASVSTVGAGTRNAQLVIGVPAGVVHEAWGTNTAPRVMQSVTDGDFGVEAKFDSLPTSKFQDQGVLVEQDAGRWLRFSVYSDGPGKFVFAASTTKGVSTQRLKATVSMSTPPLWLRVVRTGSVWQLLWSADGVAWTSVGSFDDVLTVSKVGVYAGNSGSSPPAFQSKVDYLFDSATPLADDPDVIAPVISNIALLPGSSAAKVSWETDETTSARVEYGLTTSYGQSAVSSTTTGSTVTLSRLAPSTEYHYRIVVHDEAGNEAATPDLTLRTTAAEGPAIDTWYGPRQVFGRNGLPQPWVNVVGNTRDGDGLTSLTYSLNGGAPKDMGLGSDTRRLQDPGDFNADIRTSALVVGENQVRFTATDALGHVSTSTVVVVLEAGAAPTLPYEVSWKADVPLLEQAQVVDGLWTTAPQQVANALYGYDRVVALGSPTWTDYEVTVPVTVHSIGPASGSFNSGAALVGVGLRWQGHTIQDNKQPAWGYKKAGAYVWQRWYSTPSLEAVGNGGDPKQLAAEDMALGRKYVFKTRISTSAGTTTLRSRTWPVGTPEPTTWEVSITETDAPAQGSIVLIAHQLKATFGVVTVTATPP